VGLEYKLINSMSQQEQLEIAKQYLQVSKPLYYRTLDEDRKHRDRHAMELSDTGIIMTLATVRAFIGVLK
jgi:hypothetical protein